MKTNPHRSLAIVMAFCLAASQAQATLLIEESFDYTLGALAGNDGGTGFDEAWRVTASGTGPSAAIVDGLTFNQLETSGNAAQFSATGSHTLNGFRSIDFDQTSGSVWGSYLFKTTLAPVVSSSWDSRFRNGSDAGTREYQVSPIENASDEPAVGYNGGVVTTDANPFDGETYLFLSRLSGLGQGSNTVELWIFDEAGFADWRADGSIETDLTVDPANNPYTIANGYVSGTFAGVVNLTDADVLNLITFSSTASASTNVLWDELRYGTTLADVAPIPEPTAGGLVALAGACLLFRRRRAS